MNTCKFCPVECIFKYFVVSLSPNVSHSIGNFQTYLTQRKNTEVLLLYYTIRGQHWNYLMFLGKCMLQGTAFLKEK